MHLKCLESRLDQLTSAITILTNMLVSKDKGQDMEYEVELVHFVLAVACNAIASFAMKVEDSILHMMTALVAMKQPTML